MFDKLKVRIKPSTFYNIDSSKMTPDLIRMAIEKGVNLKDDVNGKLKTNVKFLEKYFAISKLTIEEVKLVDFSIFLETNKNNLLRILLSNNTECFIAVVNENPSLLLNTEFELNKEIYSKINDRLITLGASIPKKYLEKNDELISKLIDSEFFAVLRETIYENLTDSTRNKYYSKMQSNQELFNMLSQADVDYIVDNDLMSANFFELLSASQLDINKYEKKLSTNQDYIYYFFLRNNNKDTFMKYFNAFSNFSSEQKLAILKGNLDYWMNIDEIDYFLNDNVCHKFLLDKVKEKLKSDLNYNDKTITILSNKNIEEIIEIDHSKISYLVECFFYLPNVDYEKNFDLFLQAIIECRSSIDDKKLETFLQEKSKYIIALANQNMLPPQFTTKSYLYTPEELETLSQNNVAVTNYFENIFEKEQIVNGSSYLYTANTEEERNKVLEIAKYIKEKNIDARIEIKMFQIRNEDEEFLQEIHEFVKDAWIIPVKNQTGGLLYKVEDIIEKNRILDNYAKSVTAEVIGPDGKMKKLSPFEQRVAIYGIVASYQEYFDDEEKTQQSRSVYEFINHPNSHQYEYEKDGTFYRNKVFPIVCVGYSHFDIELQNRCGFNKCFNWSVASSEFPFDHSVVMSYIEDPKYKIKGMYMSDATNDEQYNYSSIKAYKRLAKTRKEAETTLNFLDCLYDSPDNLKNLPCTKEEFAELISDEHAIPYEKQLMAMINVKRFVNKNAVMVENLEIADYVSPQGQNPDETYEESVLALEAQSSKLGLFEMLSLNPDPRYMSDKSFMEIFKNVKIKDLPYYVFVAMKDRMINLLNLDKNKMGKVQINLSNDNIYLTFDFEDYSEYDDPKFVELFENINRTFPGKTSLNKDTTVLNIKVLDINKTYAEQMETIAEVYSTLVELVNAYNSGSIQI